MIPTPAPGRERGAHPATRFMVAVMLLVGTANIRWAEQLTVNGGFGWDGRHYGAWAKDFYGQIFVARVPEYYVGRVLPSALVHYGLRALSVTRSDAHVILAFQIYNLLCLTIAVWAWGRIARVLDLSTNGAWLGFCFLFLNYAILKNNFYHAVLTDTTAFTLGILTIYCFLVDSAAGMLALMVAGGFTWSTVTQLAALLYVLPRGSGSPAGVRAAPRASIRRERVFALGVAAVAVAGISAVSIRQMHFHPENHQGDLLAWWPFSVAIVFVYLWLALETAAAGGRLFDPGVLRAVRWRRAAAAILVMAGLGTIHRVLGNGETVASWLGLPTFLSAVTEPGVFLVAHVVYYGPVVLLIALFWRHCCAAARAFGVGLEAFVVLTVMASINSQSRFLINTVPMFVVLLVGWLDRGGLTTREVALWAALCVACSKVWYTFNTAPQIWDGRMASLLEFPLQHYFMNAGPWMSRPMYVLQGAIVAAMGLIIAAVMRARSVEPDVQ